MSSLTRNWWMFAARGALAMLFGLTVLAWSGIGLGELVLLFGTYALIDGLGAIASAIRVSAGSRPGWPLLAEGVVSIGLGILAWVSPFIPWALLYVIASWGVITGVLEIAAAMSLRDEPTGKWLLTLSGASSVLLGMFLMALPGAGAPTVVRIIGLYAVVFGLLLLVSSLRLRGGLVSQLLGPAGPRTSPRG
jgi:uncharacterized membrane protein HdeD (DUF308 family)